MSEVPLHSLRSSRFIPAPIERISNAILSRGPGYEPTPIGRQYETEAVRGYYMDFSSKTSAPGANDPARIFPAPLAQLALGWWERTLAGEAGAEGEFLRVCGLLEERGRATDGDLRWWHDIESPKYRLGRGWCSALAQGQAASVFTRAYLATSDERYAQLARRALNPLLATRTNDLVSWTASGPVLEEAPTVPASHILNGWISALWGLHDFAVAMGDADVAEASRVSVECLLVHLPAYDADGWSRYSLYPHTLEDLAKPIYHRCHIVQLTVMHELTGQTAFAEMARRWAACDGGARFTYAIAQKALFALAEGRRRRHLSPT